MASKLPFGNFLGLNSGDGKEFNPLDFFKGMFTGAGRVEGDGDAGISGIMDSALGPKSPFGAVSNLFNDFFGLFGNFFNPVFNFLSSSKGKRVLSSAGVENEVTSELWSSVPDSYRKTFLQGCNFVRSKRERIRIKADAEEILSNETLSSFEKKLRIRSLMANDLANAVSDHNPELAEKIHNTCMQELTGSDEAKLADLLADMREHRRESRPKKSVAQKVREATYDKAITRADKAISHIDAALAEKRAELMSQIREANPDTAHEITSAEMRGCVDRILSGDVFAASAHIARLPVSPKYDATADSARQLVAEKQVLSEHKQGLEDRRAGGHALVSPDSQEHYAAIEKAIRTHKINVAITKIERERVEIGQKRDAVLERIDILIGGDDLDARVEAAIGDFEAAEEGTPEKARLHAEKELLEGIQQELARINGELEKKERFREQLEAHRDVINNAGVVTDMEYKLRKAEFNRGNEELSKYVKRAEEEEMARGIIGQSRVLEAEQDLPGTKKASIRLMERMSKAIAELDTSRVLSSKISKLEDSLRVAKDRVHAEMVSLGLAGETADHDEGSMSPSELINLNKLRANVAKQEEALEAARKERLVEPSADEILSSMQRRNEEVAEVARDKVAEAKSIYADYDELVQAAYLELDGGHEGSIQQIITANGPRVQELVRINEEYIEVVEELEAEAIALRDHIPTVLNIKKEGDNYVVDNAALAAGYADGPVRDAARDAARGAAHDINHRIAVFNIRRKEMEDIQEDVMSYRVLSGHTIGDAIHAIDDDGSIRGAHDALNEIGLEPSVYIQRAEALKTLLSGRADRISGLQEQYEAVMARKGILDARAPQHILPSLVM